MFGTFPDLPAFGVFFSIMLNVSTGYLISQNEKRGQDLRPAPVLYSHPQQYATNKKLVAEDCNIISRRFCGNHAFQRYEQLYQYGHAGSKASHGVLYRGEQL